MSSRAVSKGAFARHFRHSAQNRETGVFTIITDTERSVLLRLTEGRITSSRCRGRDIERAIDVLASSATLRFSSAPAGPESQAEVIGVDEFLLRIGASVDADPEARPRQARIHDDGQSSVSPIVPGVDTESSVRGALEEIAVEIIGPVARMVVDEALANNATVQEAIREIAWAIPDTEVATRFLETARERIPDIEGEL